MNDNTIIAKIRTIQDLEGEEWRPIRGSNVYFVSNLGRVKSKNKHSMIILTQQKNNDGYWRVCLSLQVGDPQYYLVSRLVAEAFMPKEAGEEKEVHHIKGKDWNTVDCLAWVSKEEHNQKHKELKMKNQGVSYGEE